MHEPQDLEEVLKQHHQRMLRLVARGFYKELIKFGFEVEGVFFQERRIENQWHDIVRMGLLRTHWLKIFRAAPETR